VGKTPPSARGGERGKHCALPRAQLAPSGWPVVPAPRAEFEIWVYSPRLEAVHTALRRGRARRPALVGTAEGLPHRGIGLVKAQEVKNSVTPSRPARRAGSSASGCRDPADPAPTQGGGPRLLTDVHFSRECLDVPTTSSATPWSRARRGSGWTGIPRTWSVRGRQGHRDVLARGHEIAGRFTGNGSRRVRLGRSEGYDPRRWAITAPRRLGSVCWHSRRCG